MIIILVSWCLGGKKTTEQPKKQVGENQSPNQHLTDQGLAQADWFARPSRRSSHYTAKPKPTHLWRYEECCEEQKL
jgi:hypothetical protein